MARSISILFVPLEVISFASSFCVKPEMGGNVREICRLSMVYGTPRPVQIILSILPADWANLGAECKRLEDAGVDRIQFDVMDDNFVPNLTFGPELIFIR